MALLVAFDESYRAGDDVTLQFRTVDETGTIANITGATVKFAVAFTKDAPVISTEGSPVTATWTITDPMNGLFRVYIDGVDTEDFRGTYPCEAELVDAYGDNATVARGFLTFTADLV